jgi:aryl-alcohol dehydrogenase-like predicted oxidoreductase
VKRICAEAAAYCRGRNGDIAKLAVQFSLKNPEIATTLVGTADPANLKKNIGWLDEPIDEALLDTVVQMLDSIKDQTWIVGRPENN